MRGAKEKAIREEVKATISEGGIKTKNNDINICEGYNKTHDFIS